MFFEREGGKALAYGGGRGRTQGAGLAARSGRTPRASYSRTRWGVVFPVVQHFEGYSQKPLCFPCIPFVCVCVHMQVGEGEFGTVYKAQYLGTTVAVKVLKDDNAVAIGDFRCVGVLP